MVNIEVDVENFVELLTELLDGQDDVVDVAKARRLENQTSIFRGHFHSCDSSVGKGPEFRSLKEVQLN